MNFAIVDLLSQSPDSHLWPEAVARRLKLTLPQLMHDLAELTTFGFQFEHEPHRGIRFLGAPRQLCPDQIEWQLGTRTVGRRIEVWRRVTSTNDIAARASHNFTNHGLVVLAEEQTAGRGRRHRRWHAPTETAILMSTLLFPPEHVRNVPLLTCLAAVAVADVIIEELDLPARIKWPNDVRVAGEKVCGILVEDLARARQSLRTTPVDLPASDATQSENGSARGIVHAIVLGIGVNVNVARSDFPPDLASPATSLMILCGRRLDRSQLVQAVLRRLDYYYHATIENNATAVWKRWRELADLIGQTVRVECARGQLSGRLVDLWPDRGVTLETQFGRVIQLPSEQVLSVSELPD